MEHLHKDIISFFSNGGIESTEVVYTFIFIVDVFVCFHGVIWSHDLENLTIVTIDRLSDFLFDRLNKRDLMYFYGWAGKRSVTLNRQHRLH